MSLYRSRAPQFPWSPSLWDWLTTVSPSLAPFHSVRLLLSLSQPSGITASFRVHTPPLFFPSRAHRVNLSDYRYCDFSRAPLLFVATIFPVLFLPIVPVAGNLKFRVQSAMMNGESFFSFLFSLRKESNINKQIGKRCYLQIILLFMNLFSFRRISLYN